METIFVLLIMVTSRYVETMIRKQVEWHYGDPNTFEMLNVELWLLSGQRLAFNIMNHYYTLSHFLFTKSSPF